MRPSPISPLICWRFAWNDLLSEMPNKVWVPCFGGGLAKTSARVHHRESMPALQTRHAFALILHGLLPLQIIRESIAPICGLGELSYRSPKPLYSLASKSLWSGKRGTIRSKTKQTGDRCPLPRAGMCPPERLVHLTRCT